MSIHDQYKPQVDNAPRSKDEIAKECEKMFGVDINDIEAVMKK